MIAPLAGTAGSRAVSSFGEMFFILKSSGQKGKSMTQVEAHLVEPEGIPVRTEHWRIGMITVLIEIMEHGALLGYDWAHGNHEGQHPRP